MTTSKDLADNASLTVIARLAMIAATALLPAVGWLLLRSVSTVDAIASQVAVIHDQVTETNGNVRLVQQTQAAQAAILADHETRMRLLEHMQQPH